MPNVSLEVIDAEQWLDEIDRVFKSAYRIEAALLGVESFPPLERSKSDLGTCDNEFVGFFSAGELCGVLEVERDAGVAVIASLAVAPDRFRQGIAKSLVRYALDHNDARLLVTTGAMNVPAIKLYTALGFEAIRHFETTDGIAMVELLAPR